MIKNYYPSKRPVVIPVTKFWPVVVPKYIQKRATELGLSVDEYEARVKAVTLANTQCKWKRGDEGYPHSLAEYKKNGICRVVGIVHHYDQYGQVEWNDNPYILAVRSEKDPNSITNCTAGWLVPVPSYHIESTC